MPKPWVIFLPFYLTPQIWSVSRSWHLYLQNIERISHLSWSSLPLLQKKPLFLLSWFANQPPKWYAHFCLCPPSDYLIMPKWSCEDLCQIILLLYSKPFSDPLSTHKVLPGFKHQLLLTLTPSLLFLFASFTIVTLAFSLFFKCIWTLNLKCCPARDLLG